MENKIIKITVTPADPVRNIKIPRLMDNEIIRQAENLSISVNSQILSMLGYVINNKIDVAKNDSCLIQVDDLSNWRGTGYELSDK